MNKLQFVTLLAGLASATVAVAQPGALVTSPSVRAVNLTQPVPKQTDLVIDTVEWVYTAPHVARLAGSVRQPPSGMVLRSPVLRVTLRNAGTERWASSGMVEARVDMGAPDERAGREPSRSGRTGVSVSSGSQAPQPGIVAAASPPFLGKAPIPGSLAPGEKRAVEITLKGKGNSHTSEHLMMLLDKYYTAHVGIQSKGDDQQNNNRADFVFRLNASGAAIDPLLKHRESDPANRGTVQVRAPGS